MKTEVPTGKAEAATGCAKHGNVKTEVPTGKNLKIPHPNPLTSVGFLQLGGVITVKFINRGTR
ncbi:hypothetical protein ACEYW6_35645, partial [Nostoc sp. UIC 10607]